VTDYYERHGEELARRYDALDPGQINACWSHLITGATPGLACDIGAGSGRDARWLARRGWEVIAVEPAAALRAHGERASAGLPINWLDDSLPALTRLRDIGYRFDLVLLSAVWQHLAPPERERAFRVVSELLRPGGQLVISLRHGRDSAENHERGFHAVDAEQVRAYGRRRALLESMSIRQRDAYRQDVDWEVVAFQLPDDGTGSLALLRHVIVNDDKSSSYKLGLLRVLARLADTFPGAVIDRDEDVVDVPLGLVGLLWLKQYRKLMLGHGLPAGASAGAGFATEDFYRLADWSDYDLHVGATIAEAQAGILTRAVRESCRVIRDMPVRYISWPGQNRPVFEARRSPVRLRRGAQRIDLEFLCRFGTFRVPAHLWRTLSEFSSWLEPVIAREWSMLLGRWKIADYRSVSPEIFVWEERSRFTRIARQRLEALGTDARPPACVWTGRAGRQLDIDHCFPWARWPNNDLWNLLPATASVNREKSDRLPSIAALQGARHRVTDWWTRAYLRSPLQERFLDEASMALPGLAPGRDLDAVFEAMLHQRTRIKSNQQLRDWDTRAIAP
jgi:SAM-dependent methyltransferase